MQSRKHRSLKASETKKGKEAVTAVRADYTGSMQPWRKLLSKKIGEHSDEAADIFSIGS